MNLLSVLNRLDQHEPQSFFAPIPTQHTTNVFTLQEQIPYWFNARVGTPGWYEMQPDKSTAVFSRDMTPVERIEYLQALPRFLVFCLFSLSDDTWLVSPFNISDAQQRGWKNGQPRPMYLTQGTLQSFDVAQVRLMGDILLFEIVRPGYMQNMSRDKAHANEIVQVRLDQLRKREIEEARKLRQLTIEGKMEQSLKFMGANLLDWSRHTEGYKVTWEFQGRSHTMSIDENMHVKTAGVCLAGEDNFHSLSSIVGVMQDRTIAIESGEHGDW